MTPVPPLDHVAALSDDTGIIQHAVESVPNRSTGYCTDDVARAFIVVLQYARIAGDETLAPRLASTYLSFLHDAQLDDGRFHNFMSYARGWLDDVGTHDSVGRAMWALGYGVRYARSEAWQRLCARMLDRALAAIDWLEFPRAETYAMIGLAHASALENRFRRPLAQLAARSLARFDATAREGWHWFEDVMTYDNARLPEALLRAGAVLADRTLVEGGLRSLAFLESVVFHDDIFVPIGNDGWYRSGGSRARFGQQPLEAAAMVDAEVVAAALEPHGAHVERARRAHAWFYGKNLLGLTLASGGGCCDGLEASGVNRNMGAESTLAHLSAAYTLAENCDLGRAEAEKVFAAK